MQRFERSAQDLTPHSWQRGSGKRGLEPPSHHAAHEAGLPEVCRPQSPVPEDPPTSSQSLGAGLVPRASPVHREGV